MLIERSRETRKYVAPVLVVRPMTIVAQPTTGFGDREFFVVKQ